MNKYEVKFEVFGKKLKVVVDTDNEGDALDRVREAIVIHSIQKVIPEKKKSTETKSETENSVNKFLNDLFEQLGKK